MRYVVILLMFILLSCSSYAPNENANVLSISPFDYESDGVLRLKVSIKLSQEKAMYYWRGHIYPLFGIGLFSEAKTENGETVKVEVVEKVMPVAPNPLDIVVSDNVDYSKLLSLRIVKDDGTPYVGCTDFTLIYDTTKIKSPKSKLFPITLKSNQLIVCNMDK